jgi:hypothetical protein
LSPPCSTRDEFRAYCTDCDGEAGNTICIEPLSLIRIVLGAQVNCNGFDVWFCRNKVQQLYFVLWVPYCPEGVNDANII